MSDYAQYYYESLDESNEYADWVSEQLRKATPCLIIGMYASRKFQFEKGESMSGIEIKHDKWLSGEDGKPATHNIYLEAYEKSNPNNTFYVPSGIYRSDHCFLFLVGNYDEVFLFCTKQLRRVYENEQWYKERGVRKVETPTSKAIVWPRETVLDSPYLLHHWVFDEEAVKKHHPGQRIKGE